MTTADFLPAPSVSLIEGRPATTSLAIAEAFGKRHDHVVRSIQDLIHNTPESFSAPNFGAAEYTDEQGKPRPMYTVYFDGFMLLVMGYTGKKALEMKLAYIKAFNAMREQLEGKKVSPALETEEERKRRLARERLRRHRERKREQLALTTPKKDKFEAYMEQVEEFRARTDSEIRRLLQDGLRLVDVYKFGPKAITGFSGIFLTWLHEVAVSPSPLVAHYWSMDRAIEYSPLYLVREMEKILPDYRHR